MEGESSSLQSKNNPGQVHTFDFTGIIDQVIGKTSEEHVKCTYSTTKASPGHNP